MKKIWMAMGLCLVVILTGCSDKAKQNSEVINIENEELAIKSGIDIFGEVKVASIKEIVIDFPGIVEKIHIKDGQKIKKGDLIMTFNFDEYQTNIMKKQNEIELYDAQLKKLRQNINPLSHEVSRLKKELDIKQGYISGDKDPEVKALERNLEMTHTDIEILQKEYEANKEIFDIGGISAKELEDAKQRLIGKEKEKKDLLMAIEKLKTNRVLEVNQLLSGLKNNEAQLTNTDKQNEISVLELESRLKIAQIDLETMKNKLSKSYIKENSIIADIDNLIVYDLECYEGTQVGKGEGAIIKMMDENTLFISVDIPEEFISRVDIGNEALIMPYADKANAIKGKVIRLAQRAIKQNGETIIKADIAIDGEKGILKPGLTVDVTIYE